jgi:hypothetical protein
MNAVDISNSGTCFRFFVAAFNLYQGLYVSNHPESKKEVLGEALLSTILDQYAERVCNAIERTLSKTRGNVKKMLRPI